MPRTAKFAAFRWSDQPPSASHSPFASLRPDAPGRQCPARIAWLPISLEQTDGW